MCSGHSHLFRKATSSSVCILTTRADSDGSQHKTICLTMVISAGESCLECDRAQQGGLDEAPI